MINMQHIQEKSEWKTWYTAVLIANAVYIVVFYFLTASLA